MSTYTDLHNKIKENITVGYSPDDRITTQQVRFYNTKNEYWGTFRGDFAAENVDVNGGTLKNLTIVDSTLSNVSWPGGVNFDEFGRNLTVLSTEVTHLRDVESPNLHEEIHDEAQFRQHADDELERLISTTDIRLSSYTQEVKQNLKHELEVAQRALTDQDKAISTVLVHQDRSISTYLNNELTALSSQTINNDIDLSNSLTSISSDLNSTITTVSVELDTHLSDEISARIANDEYLSAEHDQLRNDFGEEIRDRTSEDIKLFNKISTEIVDRISVDTQLSNEIDALHESTSLSLDIMDDEYKTLLEHDRHYVIKYQLGGDGTLPKDYPYALDDYAVNIFETGNIAGRVYWNNRGQRVEVGHVLQTKPDSPYAPLPIDFLPLTDIKSNALLSAFDPYLTYSFNENVQSHRSGENRSYVISFNQSEYSIASQLSDCYFDLEPISEQYHQVFIDGYAEKSVGYVKAANPPGEASNIVSGLLTFDTAGSTEFDAFSLYQNVEFNTEDLSVITRPNNTKVTYLGSNRFKIEKNITSRNYIPLRNFLAGEDPLPEPFGSIYQYDGTGHPTVVADDEGQLKSVLVNLVAPYDSQTYKLEKNDAGEYSLLIAEGEKGNTANVYLSAVAAGLNTHFYITEFSTQYKYTLYGLDEDGVKQKLTGCYIVPGVYNKTFVDAGEDCQTIKVYIADLLWLNVFKNKSPFTLTKAEDNIWTYECTDDAGESVLNIKYNGTTRKLRFKITALNGGQVVAQSYDIDVNEPEAIHTEPFIRCATKQIDLSRFDDLIYTSDTYNVIVDEHVRGNTDPSYRFSIDTSDLNIIKLQVPEKTSYDISREFIVAIKYKSVKSDTRFRKFKLVDNNGNPVELVNTTYGEPYLYVMPNKLAVYQVKEVYDGEFVAVDLNDEEDNYQIDQLHKKDDALSAEIDALSASLSADIDSLSAHLSADVDALSTSISAEVENISASLSIEIDSLSSALSTDIDSLSTSLSNEIDLLSSSISGTVDLSVETLEDKLSAVNVRIDDISVDVNGHINYKGEVAGFVTDSDGHPRQVTSLSDMFANSEFASDRLYGTSVDIVLKNGFLYQVVSRPYDSGNERFTVSEDTRTYTFEVGDYIIVNCRKSGCDAKKISDLTLDDIDVIDAIDRQDIAYLSASIGVLSVNISAEVISLSTHLSGDVDSLSTRLSSEIDTLSTKLSTDIGLLSTSLSTTAESKYFQLSGGNSVSGTNEFLDKIVAADANISAIVVPALSTIYVEDVSQNVNKILELSVDNLNNAIVSNDHDINFLSSTLSDLSTDLSAEINVLSADRNTLSSNLSNLSSHYFTNVSSDIGLSYTYPVGSGTHTQPLSVDQLLIVDEVTFDRYRLTIRNGALNINKVDSVREA